MSQVTLHLDLGNEFEMARRLAFASFKFLEAPLLVRWIAAAVCSFKPSFPRAFVLQMYPVTVAQTFEKQNLFYGGVKHHNFLVKSLQKSALQALYVVNRVAT